MNSAGVVPKDLLQQWSFSVEINGWDAAYFTKATLPTIEFEEVMFDPAGSNYSQKAPGRLKFGDFTLEKGVRSDLVDLDVYSWLTTQASVSIGINNRVSQVVKDIALVEYTNDGAEYRRWDIKGAWIKNYEPGERDGSKSENVIEKVVFACQSFNPIIGLG